MSNLHSMNSEKRTLGCRVTNCSSLPKTIPVLVLKAPHPVNKSFLGKQDNWDVQSLELNTKLRHQKLIVQQPVLSLHTLEETMFFKNQFLHLPHPLSKALAQTQAEVNKLNELEPVIENF